MTTHELARIMLEREDCIIPEETPQAPGTHFVAVPYDGGLAYINLAPNNKLAWQVMNDWYDDSENMTLDQAYPDPAKPFHEVRRMAEDFMRYYGLSVTSTPSSTENLIAKCWKDALDMP